MRGSSKAQPPCMTGHCMEEGQGLLAGKDTLCFRLLSHWQQLMAAQGGPKGPPLHGSAGWCAHILATSGHVRVRMVVVVRLEKAALDHNLYWSFKDCSCSICGPGIWVLVVLTRLCHLQRVPVLVSLPAAPKETRGQDTAEHGASGLEGVCLSASLAHASLQIYYQ